MDDLIRRSDALYVIDHTGNAMSGFLWEELNEDIKAAPAVDAVEVVRCWECIKDWCDHWHKDGYCAWGQRREDGDV